MGFKSSISDYKLDKHSFGFEIAKAKFISRIVFSIDQKLYWKLPLKKYWLKLYTKKEEYVYAYLLDKNKPLLERYTNISEQNLVKSDIVWFCWFQGIEEAPYNVQISFESVKNKYGNKNVILIDNSNLNKYINVPDDIENMWREGQITNQLFSDIIRTDLLYNWGGLWIDATCLIFDKPLEYSDETDLFYAKGLDEFPSDYYYLDIREFEAFFIYSKKNNLFLKYINESLIDYCRTSDRLIDYLLVNYFAKIGRENVTLFNEQHRSIPNNNSQCELLRRKLNEKRTEVMISEDTFFVKLNAGEEYSTNNQSLFEVLIREGKNKND